MKKNLIVGFLTLLLPLWLLPALLITALAFIFVPVFEELSILYDKLSKKPKT